MKNQPQKSPSQTRRVLQLRDGKIEARDDVLSVEEPLEIRLGGRRFTATMRTPGDDDLLTRGLLFTEGVAGDNDDFENVSLSTRCRDDGTELVNVADVMLHELPDAASPLWDRALIANSSCGLCGKASVEAMTSRLQPLASTREGERVALETLLALPQKMRAQQEVFARTGGLHAAGIFDFSGNCRALYEDIGRHNATDKAIGRGLVEGWLPQRDAAALLMLLVSGRASFEIVQKALVARIPIVCAVSAASNLAAELSAANAQTLVGFLREKSCTIYCGEERIAV